VLTREKTERIAVKGLNVFGRELLVCGTDPITGFYRDGCCNTGLNDAGTHTVCAIVDERFLNFSKSRGNDLTRDIPEYNFKGLKEGDRWCLCVSRWLEAYRSGSAPKIILEATHLNTLQHIELAELEKFSADSP
jgi:uncharacterized protein (DUF2237 family)